MQLDRTITSLAPVTIVAIIIISIRSKPTAFAPVVGFTIVAVLVTSAIKIVESRRLRSARFASDSLATAVGLTPAQAEQVLILMRLYESVHQFNSSQTETVDLTDSIFNLRTEIAESEGDAIHDVVVRIPLDGNNDLLLNN